MANKTELPLRPVVVDWDEHEAVYKIGEVSRWMDAAEARIAELEAENAALKGQVEEARYRPIGDNHHNAMACPYCNPPKPATQEAE